MDEASTDMERLPSEITSRQRIILAHRLVEHKVQIETVLRALQKEDTIIELEQLKGILTTLSKTLYALFGEEHED